jgi:hypothetical protein
MRVKLAPFLVTKIEGEFPEYILQHLDIRHFQKRLLKDLEGHVEEKPGLMFINRVLGTDFGEYDQFKLFTEIYGFLPFVNMLPDTPIQSVLNVPDGLEDTTIRQAFLRTLTELDRYGEDHKDWQIYDAFLKVLYEAFLRDNLMKFTEFLRGFKVLKNDRIELLSELFKAAEIYGLELFVSETEQGIEFVLTGKEFRSSIMLLLAQEIYRGNAFPEPATLSCKQCGGDINPRIYNSKDYCSRECSQRAYQKSNPLKTLTDRVRKKASRHLSKNEYSVFKKDLKSALARERTEQSVRGICRKYRINPDPEPKGRPPKLRKPPAKEKP